MARLYRASEAFLERMDEGYRKTIHLALDHRPSVIGAAVLLVVATWWIYPMISVELMPQADEGEVNVNAELGVGTRVERTEEALLKLEELVKQYVPEATTIITDGGGAATTSAAAAAAVVAARPTAARSASSSCHAIATRNAVAARTPNPMGWKRPPAAGRTPRPSGGGRRWPVTRIRAGSRASRRAARAAPL